MVFFRNCQRVNRSEHGRGTNEFNKFSDYKGDNCYTPIGYGCFLKCNTYILKKDFSMEYFEFTQSHRRRTIVMTRGRIPEFCEGYKRDNGIFDLKSKRILPRSVKQKDKCLYIHKNQHCVIWKK